MYSKKTIRDIDVSGKRVLVRVDFNVPLSDGKVADDMRIRAALPTIRYLVDHGAKTILMSHLGRPKGAPDDKLRLQPAADVLSQFLGEPVKQLHHTIDPCVTDAVSAMQPGDVVMLENLRFNPGEKENDPAFARQLADLADVYVDDAFGAAHRAHASTVGVPQYLQAVGGLLLEREVNELSNLLEDPARPFAAVLGGNKVSDKIGVVNRLLDTVDALLVGGGMCFTFLRAKGVQVGKSICEDEEIDHARQMMEKSETNDVAFYLPSDVRVATRMSEDASSEVVDVSAIPPDRMGLDIGPRTIEMYTDVITQAATIFWNGPMGVFEMRPFEAGTREVALAIANSSAISIVGGGDSDAALRKFGLEDEMSFVSTGGGASMKMLEGTELPGVAALNEK